MNSQTAQILCELNTRFYAEQCESFASTREHQWHGWQNLDVLGELCAGEAPVFSVFDLACGNLRFESFLASEFPAATITFYAVDNCDALVPQAPAVRYQSLDVLAALQEGPKLNERYNAPLCDLSVCFGFMHHVPLATWRERILLSLVRQTRPGGYVVVALWQFLSNTALAAKAQVTHERARAELSLPPLESGDYLLGWKDTPGVYRYCQSFSEPEIDHLAAVVAARATVLSRFASDGRTDNLNTYLVLRVH